MNVPRKHHYVPRFIVRNFASSDGFVWSFSKGMKKHPIAKRHPNAIFFENDRYSKTKSDGSIDVSVEKDLSKLEGRASVLISKIVDQSRRGVPVRFSTEEMEIWSNFFYTQWRRTPDEIDSIFGWQLFKQHLESSIKDLRNLTRDRRFQDVHVVDWLAKSEQAQQRLYQNAQVDILKYQDGRVPTILREMGIGVYVIKNPKKSFVLGSRSIIKLTRPGSTTLGNVDVEAWLPLAWDVIATPVPNGGGLFIRNDVTDSQIRNLNQIIFDNSSVVVSRSDVLLRSLSNRK